MLISHENVDQLLDAGELFVSLGSPVVRAYWRLRRDGKTRFKADNKFSIKCKARSVTISITHDTMKEILHVSDLPLTGRNYMALEDSYQFT